MRTLNMDEVQSISGARFLISDSIWMAVGGAVGGAFLSVLSGFAGNHHIPLRTGVQMGALIVGGGHLAFQAIREAGY